jgi:hypothetical protein
MWGTSLPARTLDVDLEKWIKKKTSYIQVGSLQVLDNIVTVAIENDHYLTWVGMCFK